jgi:hypothetical protein
LSAIELPSDAEALGNLIESGDMTVEQIDLLIEKHSHYVYECEDACPEIIDSFDEYPLRLLLEHNTGKMTLKQCELVHEMLYDHILPQDQGTSANVAKLKLELAVGRGLLGYVAGDLAEWLDEESIDKTFSDEEILEGVQGYLLQLTAFDDCNESRLESFLTAYHEPGNWREGGLNCEGEFESCESCQQMLRLAVSKLKR